MVLKLFIALGIIIVIFLGYVATRPSQFRYERDGLILATPEKIFPYLSQFKLGDQWSPYEKIDPAMKKTFSGVDGHVGAIMEFEGNKEAGSGKLEMLHILPNELVEIRLTMLKPFFAENLVRYKLNAEPGGTRFIWTMSGNNGFIGKLISVIIDCDKMIAGQFSVGITNLKTLIESQK